MATLKTGVRHGRRGYRWSVGVLSLSFDEAIDILGETGYSHFAAQFRELARQDDPSHCGTVDVRAIENFYEVRDHGGVIGNINVRVFFGLDAARRTIVTLGCIKKQNDGPTPLGDKERMRVRWARYLRGEFGFIE